MFKRLIPLVALLLPLVAACGGTTAPAATTAPAPTTVLAPTAVAAVATVPAPTAGAAGDLQVDTSKLSKQLNLFTWTDYTSPEVLAEFEKEYGVKVIVDLYDANESMIPKISAGNSGYDIVVPSDYAVQSMIQDKLLAPLDKTLLPNLRHIDPNNLNLYFDPGNVYSVPYFWATTGIAYNKKFFPTPPDSWSVLFDPAQLASIKGKFTMLDDPRETPGAALIFNGNSINDTDVNDLKQVEALLKAQKDYVSGYDSANVNLKLATEEIVIAHAWSGMAAQAIAGIEDKPGNSNIAFVIPKEGGTIWQDNLAIVADSPNQYTANVFINFMLRPDVAARNTDFVLYLTPNKDARALLAQKTRDLFATGIEPDAATRQRLQWIERNDKTDTAFSDLWTQVRGQ